jgi:hypothetical protein
MAGDDPFEEHVPDTDADRLVVDIRPPVGLRDCKGFHGKTLRLALARAVARLRRALCHRLRRDTQFTRSGGIDSQ